MCTNATHTPCDCTLIACAAGGDRKAFAALVTRHRKYARVTAYAIVRDGEDAEEVTQEAFVKVWRHLADFDGAASFTTWFYRIVTNTALDHRRRNKRHAQHREILGGHNPVDVHEDVVCETPTPEETASRGAEEHRAEVAVAALTAAHRAVLMARADGLPYADIATKLRIPVGTVMSRLWHARRHTQAALAEAV